MPRKPLPTQTAAVAVDTPVPPFVATQIVDNTSTGAVEFVEPGTTTADHSERVVVRQPTPGPVIVRAPGFDPAGSAIVFGALPPAAALDPETLNVDPNSEGVETKVVTPGQPDVETK